MKITPLHRNKLTFYLKEFYKHYPSEKYTIFHAVRGFKKRLKEERKDAWIGVAGRTGEGKSLLCLMFMTLFGRSCNLTKNVAYVPTGSQIMDMFDKLNFQCLLVDEAAREMRAVNWQSKQQQGVNVRAMTDRFKNNLVFLNMPNFSEFTKSMRVSNLEFRMIVLYRTNEYARIVIQRKSRNWRNPDPWGDEEANVRYIKTEKRHKELDNELILNIERSLPVTIMDFIVPNLENILPDITTEYERLKLESRKLANKEEEHTTKKNMHKEKYEDLLIKITKLLEYNSLGLGRVKVGKTEISKALGLGLSTYNKYLEMQPKIKGSEIRNKINETEKK